MRHAEIDKNYQKIRLSFEHILLWFCAIGMALILIWILRFCNYGIDFIGEDIYLAWIGSPYLYDWSAAQFGFVYHFLYLLLSVDIASLRQANIVITFGLSWGLVYLVLSSLVNEFVERKAALHIAAPGLATASLIAFYYWLPISNYNSLAFQALRKKTLEACYALRKREVSWKKSLPIRRTVFHGEAAST